MAATKAAKKLSNHGWKVSKTFCLKFSATKGVAQLVEWSLPEPKVLSLNPIRDTKEQSSTHCNFEKTKKRK